MTITKEEIYRQAIREVGAYTIVPIKNEAVEEWIRIWQVPFVLFFAGIPINSLSFASITFISCTTKQSSITISLHYIET